MEKTESLYCVKCKKMVNVENTKLITMKSDRPALSGKCPKCGTRTFKIIAKS